MGLMKIATYYRKCNDDVRFFKGDLKKFAAQLLCEEFCAETREPSLRKYFSKLTEYIKIGKYSVTPTSCDSVTATIPVEEIGDNVPNKAPDAAMVPIKRSEIFSLRAIANDIGIIIALAGIGPGPAADKIAVAKKKKIGSSRFFPFAIRTRNPAI